MSRESGKIESTERVLYSTKAKRNIVQLNGDEQIYSLSRESQEKQNGRSNTLESKTVATQTETVASETPCQTLNRQFFDELKLSARYILRQHYEREPKCSSFADRRSYSQ